MLLAGDRCCPSLDRREGPLDHGSPQTGSVLQSSGFWGRPSLCLSRHRVWPSFTCAAWIAHGLGPACKSWFKVTMGLALN